MDKEKSFAMFISGALIVAICVIVLLLGRAMPGYASVAVSNEYMATSTAASTGYGATITGSKLIRTGQGALGSIIITGAAAGVINFYDATTTDITKRTGNTATSTILIASIPASLAAGTYVFDVAYKTGLFFDLPSGTMPTTTVTYR